MRFASTVKAMTAASLLAAPWGCGPGAPGRPETLPVWGKVTYRGQPVPKGTITFQSDGGTLASGVIQPDGTYQLTTFEPGDGAVPGHHRVSIVANEGDPTQMPGSPGYVPPKDLVPRRYNQPESSGLEANVTKESREINYDLK